jgi:hypothetical protein
MMEKLDNKKLVMEATQLVNSMFKPSKSMKKEDILKGFSEQDDQIATGKRLKNQRKK